MNIEVLVAAMNEADHSLPARMGIRTDALIGNQCAHNEVEEYTHEGHTVRIFSFAERGVGLNRNNTLLRAQGDILLFADEDETLSPDYAEQVARAFAETPQADGLIFNICTVGDDRGRRQNKRVRRVRLWNALNYGAVRIAVRRTAISREGITFNTNFGGGTPFSFGEDNLFIVSMLRRGLRLYTHPYTVATVDQGSSSWFEGYTEKYLYDKGVLFRAVSRRLAGLLCLQDLVRHPFLYRKAGLSLPAALRIMRRGVRGYKSLRPFAPKETSRQ